MGTVKLLNIIFEIGDNENSEFIQFPVHHTKGRQLKEWIIKGTPYQRKIQKIIEGRNLKGGRKNGTNKTRSS